jgi:formamidopyrimidine-DNA glycosylase
LLPIFDVIIGLKEKPMPELPEVETVCRGLAKALPGHAIEAVTLNRDGMRIPFPPELKKIAHSKILGIDRRAKYVLIRLSSGQTLILHLGMSGRLLIHEKGKKYTPGKHDHLILHMNNGTSIVLNDPRRFGLAALAETKNIAQHKLFKHLGPEPLEKEFSPAYLAAKLKGKKVAIKLAIMDQRLVVGVGNIYASEALFMSGIDPRRATGTLKPAEIKKLANAIKAVLKKAIAAGGSSLRDYVQTDGELGYFQHHFTVYDREGQKCKGCTCDIKKTGGVRRLTQGGRSTFYCPVKQG